MNVHDLSPGSTVHTVHLHYTSLRKEPDGDKPVRDLGSEIMTILFRRENPDGERFHLFVLTRAGLGWIDLWCDVAERVEAL